MKPHFRPCAGLGCFTDDVGTAPLIALAAASGFAVSTSLQHSAASRVTHSATTLSLLRQLATSRRWVLASLLGLTAFALHALALHLGSLALVQPLMLCGVVLAVPLRTSIGRRLPRRDEFLAVAVTSVGLIVLLSATTLSGHHRSRPGPGRARVPGRARALRGAHLHRVTADRPRMAGPPCWARPRDCCSGSWPV